MCGLPKAPDLLLRKCVASICLSEDYELLYVVFLWVIVIVNIFFFLVWELRGTYKLDITNKYHYFTWENNINWIHFCLGIRLADMRMFLADSCFVWKFQVKRLFYLSPRKTTYLEMCFVWWPDLELPWEIYGLLNTTRAFSLQTLVSYMTFFLTDTFLVQIMSNLSIFL